MIQAIRDLFALERIICRRAVSVGGKVALWRQTRRWPWSAWVDGPCRLTHTEPPPEQAAELDARGFFVVRERRR